MAYSSTRAYLRQFVRTLTDIYSSDIVDDASINTALNYEYFELEKRQKWSWSAGANGLTTDSSVPAFDGAYHLLLAYRVATNILVQNGDNTQRTQEYKSIADRYESELYIYDLNRNAVGNSSTQTNTVNTYDNLIKQVRLYTGIFDDTFSNTFIQNKLVEEFNNLNISYNWPWKNNPSFSSTQNSLGWLDGDKTDPYYRDNTGNETRWYSFSNILAYGVAAKLATLTNKESVAKTAQAEYDITLAEMKKLLLVEVEKPAAIYNNQNYHTTVANLVELSKQLTSDLSMDIPSSLLLEWVYEEIGNLSSERDWRHLRGSLTSTLPANTNTINPNLPDFKVLSMFRSVNNAPADEIKPLPNGLSVEPNSKNYYYIHDMINSQIVIVPTPTEEINIGAEIYINTMLSYNTANGLRFNDLGYVNINEQFRMLIPYRVAIKGLLFSPNQPNKELITVYKASADRLYDNMINFYQNEHNYEPIQIGVNGLEQRKYIPFFKVN